MIPPQIAQARALGLVVEGERMFNWFDHYQTTIVGLLGFSGVILTLWWTARLARIAREEAIVACSNWPPAAARSSLHRPRFLGGAICMATG
jgi:hypothetical protein